MKPIRSLKPRDSGPRAFLKSYLRPLALSSASASLLAFVLGIVAALEGLVIGPSFALLAERDPDREYRLAELFKDVIAGILTDQFGLVGTIRGGDLVLLFPIALLVLASCKAAFQTLSWWIWEYNGERVSRSLRHDLISAYCRIDPYARATKAEGEQVDQGLSAMLTNDVRVLREFIVHFYGGVPRELSKITFYVATLYLLSAKYLFLFICVVLPAGILLKRFGRKLRRRSRSALDLFSELAEWVQGRLSGIETVKHFGTETSEIQRMRATLDTLAEKSIRAARIKARSSPMLEIFAAAAIGMILYFALGEILRGKGNAAVGFSFLALLGLLGQSASSLARYYNTHKEASAARDRLYEAWVNMQRLAGDSTEGQSAGKIGNIEGEAKSPLPLQNPVQIAARSLGFRYAGASEDALSEFSHEFRRGTCSVILGRSGSGKSTLMRILLGLYPAQKGELLRAASGGIGYLPQKCLLAPDTLIANLTYPDMPAAGDEARAWAALRTVGLETAVKELEHGLETRIGDGGRALSGGQTQRLLLARLLCKSYEIICIDEGTSAVDPQNESLILASIQALCRAGKTVLMISHRLAPLAIADEVLVLAKGRLVFAGTPMQFTEPGRGQELLT